MPSCVGSKGLTSRSLIHLVLRRANVMVLQLQFALPLRETCRPGCCSIFPSISMQVLLSGEDHWRSYCGSRIVSSSRWGIIHLWKQDMDRHGTLWHHGHNHRTLRNRSHVLRPCNTATSLAARIATGGWKPLWYPKILRFIIIFSYFLIQMVIFRALIPCNLLLSPSIWNGVDISWWMFWMMNEKCSWFNMIGRFMELKGKFTGHPYKKQVKPMVSCIDPLKSIHSEMETVWGCQTYLRRERVARGRPRVFRPGGSCSTGGESSS